MVADAVKIHKKNNFSNDVIKPEAKNEITRLMTNEFFFYTKRPLTLKEFEEIQQDLYNLAKEQPDNFHLVLGSFSVLTNDNLIMNVTPFIQCGKNPIVNYSVKNQPSSIDPYYKDVNTNNNVITKYQVASSKNDISKCKIKLNNKEHSFSFNNTFECQSLGNISFHFSFDICLDHLNGVAKINMNNKIDNKLFTMNKKNSSEIEQEIPTLSSHAVLSNSINLFPKQFLSNNLTHVDPMYTKVLVGDKEIPNNKPLFGCSYNMVEKKPFICSSLPLYEKNKACIYNYFLQQKKLLNYTYNDDYSILMAAVDSGNDALVKILLDYGGNPNFKSSDNRTVFDILNNNNNIDNNKKTTINKLLLNHQLIKDTKWRDPNDLFKIKNLIDAGADPNVAVNNKTILMVAAESGHVELVKYLLNMGADASKMDVNKNNSSALGYLNISNQRNTDNGNEIRELLRNSLNNQLLTKTVWRNPNDLFKIKNLIDAGADPNVAENNKTILMVAAESGHVELVKYLLNMGADVNLKDKYNCTALQYLRNSGNNLDKKLKEQIESLLSNAIVNRVSSQNKVVYNYKNATPSSNTNFFKKNTEINSADKSLSNSSPHKLTPRLKN